MNDTRKVWSAIETLSLIEAYRSKPNLWDPSDLDFRNMGKKADSLKEIGDMFGVGILEIERKLKNVITQYQREVRALKTWKNTGSPGNFIPKWFGYSAMTFLNNKQKLRQGIKLPAQSEESDDSCNGQETINPLFEMVTTESHYVATSPHKRHKIIPKKRPKCEIMPENPFVMMDVPNRVQEKDIYDIFGDLVARDIRGLSTETRRLNLREAIQKLIMDAKKEDASKIEEREMMCRMFQASYDNE